MFGWSWNCVPRKGSPSSSWRWRRRFYRFPVDTFISVGLLTGWHSWSSYLCIQWLMFSNVLQPIDRCNSMTAPVRNISQLFEVKKINIIHFQMFYSYNQWINQMEQKKIYLEWECSSVVEHSTADRDVPGLNQGVPFREIFFSLKLIT